MSFLGSVFLFQFNGGGEGLRGMCVTDGFFFFFFFFVFYFFFNFIFKLYIIVLVLPNIKMNPPQVYMCSPS